MVYEFKERPSLWRGAVAECQGKALWRVQAALLRYVLMPLAQTGLSTGAQNPTLQVKSEA